MDCLNLCPTSSVSESTQYLPTQSGDLESFDYEDGLSSIMSNFNLDALKRNPSPDSNDFFGDLCGEFQVNNVDSPLKDVLKNTSQKHNVLYDENAEFDFTAGFLHPERLKEFGMKKSVLDLAEKGIPVNLSYPLFPGDIKNRRNSRNIQKNFNVIRNLISSLVMAGHVQKVNFKPLAVSPLNVVPKANCSPRLIHDFSLLKKFVPRGSKVKHINVSNLAQTFSKESYFCKLDLSNGYFHFPIENRIENILASRLITRITFLILCASATPRLPTFFNSFLKKLLEFCKNKI